MKNAVLQLMDQKMEVDAVRIGFLSALVAETLMQKQVLTAVSAPIFVGFHRISFTKFKIFARFIMPRIKKIRSNYFATHSLSDLIFIFLSLINISFAFYTMKKTGCQNKHTQLTDDLKEKSKSSARANNSNKKLADSKSDTAESDEKLRPNSSPVCFAESEEIRDEFKTHSDDL